MSMNVNERTANENDPFELQAGKYVCECEPGWKGLNCDEDVDECLSSPCMNNATCVNQLNAFLCQCPDGLTGKSTYISFIFTSILTLVSGRSRQTLRDQRG